LRPSGVRPRPKAKPPNQLGTKILPPVTLVKERQPTSPPSLSLSTAGISIPWTGTNVTSIQRATKEMEEERNACKASIATGKSHALELLGESIDETCARPVKTMVLGALKDDPHQHWEPAHTIAIPHYNSRILQGRLATHPSTGWTMSAQAI
jgi:hypothetical protein